MLTLFDATQRESLVRRLGALAPDAARQWGTMTPAQMLAHCAVGLELATAAEPMKQKFIGKLLAPLVRGSVLGEKPFGQNSPTDPRFKISGERDFDAERDRLQKLIAQFVERGPEHAGHQVHVFFGKLSGPEWGGLMGKHLDHHLRQFGG